MTTPGRGKVSRLRYREYIQSPEWRAVRDRYWASKLPKRCYVCDKPRHPGMHLHHRTYKNLGHERLMDLVPVCKKCHDLIHTTHRRMVAKNPKVSLWEATKMTRKKVRRFNV
jgi:5-methylcytosine-specific restriction endonuclease McrA